MKTKGGRTEGARKGYGWLKSWLQKQFSEEGTLCEGKEKELLEATNPEALIRWLPRLFWEASETDRRGILRGLVPVLGTKAVPFLEEVVVSQRSRLAEKELALEQIKGLGQTPDAQSKEGLERALGFVKALPELLLNAEPTGSIPDEVLGRFQDLSSVFQGVVLRELLDRSSENLFQFLECVLARQADLWEEILEVLEEDPNDEAGRLLQGGHRMAGKALRKKIRRVHYRRSVRGLPVYPLEREETEGAIWRPPVPPKPVGLLSMPDPVGFRMVWVIRPNVRKGMLVFGGWVDDQKGLMKFFVMDPSRKELESYKTSLLENPELPVVESDAGFCAWLLEEAYQKGTPADAEEAEAFKAIRPLLKEVVPPERPEAPVYEVFDDESEEAAVEDSLEESANLLNEGLLSSWGIEAERIQPHLDKLEEISDSRIIVHPMQKKERMDTFYRETAREILSDPACRTSWRRRLEDAAWVFYKKGLEGQGRRLAHMSRYLEDPEKDTSRISFFVELVRRGLEGRLEEKKTEEKQKPSLIVKPS